MNWQFNLLIPLIIVICAVAALWVKDLLCSVIILVAYSFLMCLLWAELGAVDVAFTEAAVGAGISTMFMISTLLRTTRETRD